MNEIMDTVFLQNPLKEWVFALLSVVCGLVAGFLGGTLSAKLFMLAYKKIENSGFHKMLKKTVSLFFVYAGFKIALGKLAFSEKWELWEGRILTSVFVVLICWSISKLIDEIIVQFSGPKDAAGQPASPIPAVLIEIQPFLRKFFSFVMFFIPAIIVLKTLGYNISAVLAGFGIGGAALAFASKDLLSNFFGTLSVFIDKSFKLNDRIKVTGIDGFVIGMRLHSSQLKTLDNRIVTVPNSVFQNNPIENVTSEPHTKIFQTISIRAENGLEKTRQAIALLRGLSLDSSVDAADDRVIAAIADKPLAALSYIGVHIFKITFIFFIAKGADYWGTINAVNLEVLKRFEEAGIKMDKVLSA